MVDYVECVDWVTTLTLTPKPGAVGSSPSTPANLELRLYKGWKDFSKLVVIYFEQQIHYGKIVTKVH